MDRPGDRQGLGAGRALGRHGLRRHQQPRQPPLRRRAAPDRGRHREPLARHQGVPRPRLHRRRRRRIARRADLRPHPAQGRRGPAGDLRRDRPLRRHPQRPQHRHQRGVGDGVRGREQHGRPDLRRAPGLADRGPALLLHGRRAGRGPGRRRPDADADLGRGRSGRPAAAEGALRRDGDDRPQPVRAGEPAVPGEPDERAAGAGHQRCGESGGDRVLRYGAG